MQAVRISETGGPEVLRLVEVETPEPGPGEIRVRHHAIGLNFIEIYQRSGLYSIPLPGGLGQEAAGVVEAVGPGVTRFATGDRVAYASGPPGAYAEAHVVRADRTVRVPERVSFEVAAASMLKGMTAEYLVRRTFRVEAGMTILVHAAAGGVGTLLSQWAVSLGARVIGTAGSPEKAAFARSVGCAEVIQYREEDVAARVRELTAGEGVPVVYDSVGAATFEASLASLSRRGCLVSFGNASGPVPPVSPLRLSQAGSLYLTRPTLGDYVATEVELDASAAALFDVIERGVVTVEIGARFPLAEVRKAHETLESRRARGSSILLP
ncbi:quinone oxidoreductase family protein [Brevundimonas sp. Root1279]|uniref:quinone oxidoreductase family protein n=1 Tax=Brevundimonas sp. Root1279 TaxID=1736443 RepID=UPI0006F6B060|nr:quinone oxidoreductase [Brevundimonas sp. Root1279]KQW79835.1 quinone oxidoreductase [Brevundimonas sp. Root1279]